MKVTIFFITSTAFQYMSLYILVLLLLLLLLLSSPLQLFNTGSLLPKISLYYFFKMRWQNFSKSRPLPTKSLSKFSKIYWGLLPKSDDLACCYGQGASTSALRSFGAQMSKPLVRDHLPNQDFLVEVLSKFLKIYWGI